MHHRPLLSVLLFAGVVLPATALEWKAETLTATTVPFQKTQDVMFEFANKGPKPVAVLDLETNCDCLDAKADRKVYAPGESGTIKARFTIGDRSGSYERLITVVTDESPAPIRLRVLIEVPEVARVTPHTVSWKVNGAADEKIVDFTPAPGLEIIFTETQPTNDAFITRLETVVPGKLYQLHLQPRSTARPASAAIRVDGREKSGHSILVSAYASIQ